MIVQYKLHQSMSRKANCWNNSVAESFFATLMKQIVDGTRFQTRDQARLVVFENLEGLQPSPQALDTQLADAN